ncbi:MAG: glycoside hydrolase family 1 protein [Deltaproteobacteria bacterium]|nr:MAG: glycoside hydrolase family 1 protein [Deltaproteobacteria bacterium]
MSFLSSFSRIVLIGGFLLLCGGVVKPGGGEKDPEPIVFPEGFRFGAAISGFQAEMGCPRMPRSACEDPHSDWFAFTTSKVTNRRKKNFLSGEHPSETGPGFWELYAEDFDRMTAEMGLNAFRLSIEWSRIFPEPTDGVTGYENLKAVADPNGVRHYHEIFAALAARGIQPFVTLNHYTLPLWIHDALACNQNLHRCSPRGWLDKARTVREIAKFAGFVAREFGAEIDLWATLNEPLAVMLPGYLAPSPERTNPPAVIGRSEDARIVLSALIEAHARMYDAVVANDVYDADGDGRNATVGVVYAMAPVQPMDPEDPLDVQAARNVFYLWNMAYLNAVALGLYDENLDGTAVFREDLAGRLDFVGINYYTRITVAGLPFSIMPRLSPLMTFDPRGMILWEDYPQGIYEMIFVVQEELGLPAIVSETGAEVSGDESKGAAWLVRTLGWTGRAIEAGADVRGFFYWTLMDNFEWNHGFGLRFGLYAVEPDDPQKERRAREAVPIYGEITRSRMISLDLQRRFPLDPP